MPLSKSLAQPLRQGNLTVGAGWRVYFAPFNQAYAVNVTSTALGPTNYDFTFLGKFLDPGTPPAPYVDCGYISNFKITPGSKIGNIKSGYRMAIRAKYRGDVDEKVALEFEEVTRLNLSISSGCQVFNILAPLQTGDVQQTAGPFSGLAQPAAAMGASGYQPTGIVSTATAGLPTLFVPSGSGAAYPVNSLIVCDLDYNNTSFGYVGAAGANVYQGFVNDVDFIRKTSDYVARVVNVITGVAGQDALILGSTFPGGGNSSSVLFPTLGPVAGSKIQIVQGFGPRSGGTYIREWSCVAVMDTADQDQFMMYYPRLSPDQFSGFNAKNVDGITSLQQNTLQASFDAMAYDDPYDGETVVGYGPIWFPRPGVSPT